MSKFDIKETKAYKIAEETEKIMKEIPGIFLGTARAEANRRIKSKKED